MYPEYHLADIVAINDLSSAEMLAYLFKYDSVYGKIPYEVRVEGNFLIINNKKIRIFQEADPEKIPWREEGVECVIEATGKFTDGNIAKKHLLTGAKRVVISATSKNEDITIVMGVNEEKYDPTKHFVISSASCTTHCVASVISVLGKYFEIKRGFITEVHSYTNDQQILDAVYKGDFRRARAGALNIIPTTTSLLESLKKVFPEIAGKLEAVSIRVPAPSSALTELVFLIDAEVTPVEINEIFKNNQNKYVGYTEEPLVSMDFRGDTRSAVIDGAFTKVIDRNMVRIFAWYDNEWGYAIRLLDLIKYMAEKEF